MRKIYLVAGLSFFVRIALAQTAKPVIINFTQTANFEKAHPHIYKRCTTCKEKEIDNGWRYLNDELPIPKGAILKKHLQDNLTNPINRPAKPATPLVASPAPVKDFVGYIDPGQGIPPDTHGAVGPNHVVTATNDFIVVHNKSTGAELGRVTLSNFTGVSTSCDPYIKYDPGTQRWFLSAINCDANDGNAMAILVSTSSDPSGTWAKYSFVPSGAFFLDHPYLGFNEKWLVVSGRKFPGLASFTGPLLLLFDKANLVSGGTLSFGTNAQLIEKTPADGDAPLPITVIGTNPDPGTFYVMQNWNGDASAIRLSTVSGDIPNAEWNTTSSVYIIGGSPWITFTGSVAEQLDESRKLATNDARISTGMMVNGNIWCAHHIGITDNNVAVQWWQINGTPGTAFGKVIQRGRIGEGISNNYRYFPSIAVNQNEDAIIGYTVSSNTSRVSSAYSTRSNNTALDATDDEYVYKVGLSTYFKDFGSSRGRWGDYSHSAIDPVDGSLWTIQEYADERIGVDDNDSRYGVWWAQVAPISTLLTTDASIGAVGAPTDGLFCTVPFKPTVTIRNLGTDTLKNVKVGMLLDDVPVGTLLTVSPLALATFGNSSSVFLQQLSPAPGSHTLKIYTINPNNTADLRTANDTTTINFTVPVALPLPYTESFESPVFPPGNGSAILNPDDPGITWKQFSEAGRPGSNCIKIDFFNYLPDANGNTGQRDIYRTPKIDVSVLDSLVVSFNVAYQQYFGSDVTAPVIDSLNVIYSSDCGVTWRNAGYAKGGATLSTAPNASTAFIPEADQWRTERLVIKDFCAKNLNNIMIGFEAVSSFGNNLYIDSIDIAGYNSFNSNALLKKISQPPLAICSGNFTPAVSFANAGLDTLKSLKINYKVGDGTVTTFNWTGALLKCDSISLTLQAATAAVGTHILTVYTSEPNGVTDQATANDTLTKTFSVYTVASTPIAENFESINFPANNWGVQNINGGISFERSTSAAKTGSASLKINNPNAANFNGALDYFISPIVATNQQADSIFVDFDYAYKQGPQYPGSTVFPLDTLEVLASKDCGVTFTNVWKKWGYQLQTVDDPSYPSTELFTPTDALQWKHVKIYLDPFTGKDNFQLYFAMKGNKQNNLWLDNVNIREQVLPQKLKDQGYLIYPNPFNSSFLVHHHAVEPPTDLQAVVVYNSAGQQVWSKQYNGKAERQITINLAGKSNGIYMMKMIYTKKTIVERLVKN